MIQFYTVKTQYHSARARALSVFRMTTFHGRSFAREDLCVGDKVVGCNELLKDRQGVVREVIGSGLQKRYFVQWEDGDNIAQQGRDFSCYPKRSLRKHVPGRPLQVAVKRGSRVKRPPAHHPASKRACGSGTLAAECEESVAQETDDDGAAGSGSESSPDDADAYMHEDNDADDAGEGPVECARSAAAPEASARPPNIVQPRPLQQFQAGSTIFKEKKVRNQVVDSILWTCCSEVPEKLHKFGHEGGVSFSWSLVGLRATDPKREVDYWKLMFPPKTLNDQLMFTNKNILQWNSSHPEVAPVPPAEKWELVKVKGLRLAMALQPVKRPVKWYWQKEVDVDDVLMPPNFGERYGMSRDRFERLEQFTQYAERQSGEAADMWWPVRDVVSAFNQRRNSAVHPGLFVCLDESGSWWTGRDANKLPAFLQDGACPHVTYMKKKPKTHFVELKDLADVDSGVMLQLELQEGAAAMATKPFVREYGHHVAWSLRLLSGAGLLHSGRVLIADAAFGSVTAVKTLLKYGVLAMMIVKNAHTLYPIAEFRLWSKLFDPKSDPSHRGSTLIYTANVNVRPRGNDAPETHQIAAIAFIHQNMRTIITSYGCCAFGDPLLEQRRGMKPVADEDGSYEIVTDYRPIPCPQNVSEMIHGFGAIDQHNDLRQGILRLEYQQRTVHWWRRVITTLEGMHITDAYKVYCWDKYHNGNGEEPMMFVDFCSRLAHQLIFNDWKPSSAISERLRHHGAEVRDKQAMHTLKQVCKLPGREWFTEAGTLQDKARGLCRICKKKCSHYCEACSTGLDDGRRKKYIFYCCLKTGACLQQHLNDVALRS